MFPPLHNTSSVVSVSMRIQIAIACKSTQRHAVISSVSTTQHHPFCVLWRPQIVVVSSDIVITSRVISVWIRRVSPSCTPQITQSQAVLIDSGWWVLISSQVVVIEIWHIHHQLFPVSITVESHVLATSPSTIGLMIVPTQSQVGPSMIIRVS